MNFHFPRPVYYKGASFTCSWIWCFGYSRQHLRQHGCARWSCTVTADQTVVKLCKLVWICVCVVCVHLLRVFVEGQATCCTLFLLHTEVVLHIPNPVLWCSSSILRWYHLNYCVSSSESLSVQLDWWQININRFSLALCFSSDHCLSSAADRPFCYSLSFNEAWLHPSVRHFNSWLSCSQSLCVWLISWDCFFFFFFFS